MKAILTLSVLLLAFACSNGGSSQAVKSENEGHEFSPFIPLIETEPLGSYRLDNAYAELSFESPIYVTGVPGEDRLVVLEQRGVIQVFEDDPKASAAEVVLDIREPVLFRGEQGLLGMAFDPEFEQNRLVYLHYSRENEPPDSDGNDASSVIVSMVWDASTGRIDSETATLILEIGQPYSNHNGGMLEFGPDNFLYIAMGDGGSGGDPLDHGQNRQTLLGNLLRIDVHPEDSSAPYSIPSDNPFVDLAGVRPEIYAYGLRNPFRFSFDRVTGDLWLGDVGQNAREEINLIDKGGNYGWRVFEGNLDYTDSSFVPDNTTFEAPILDYDHSQGSSVIGGYVYRGDQVSSLIGKYVYTDYVSGTVWALGRGENNAIYNVPIASASRPTSFGETPKGELLLVYQSGGLYKLTDTTDDN